MAEGRDPDRISVVVCTRDRARDLERCLDALVGEVPLDSSDEVWIVDNGSIDATPDVARGFCRERPGWHYLREARAGLPWARNAGWRAASGSIVHFLDDDAVVHPGCLAALRAAYGEEWDGVSPIAVGTRVHAPLPDGHALPPWLDERYVPYLTRLDLGTETRKLSDSEALVGASFSVPRSALEEVGGFNVGLGAYGMDERWVEEQIGRLGGHLVYCGAAEVDHPVSVERLRVSWFRRRLTVEGRTWKLLEWHLGRLPATEALRSGLRHAAGLFWHAARGVGALLLGRTRAAFAALCRFSFCWGALTGQAAILSGRVPHPAGETS